jgi:hypothetical protein
VPSTEEVAAEAEPMDTHHPSQSRSAATIQAGQEALAPEAWEEARFAFERALQERLFEAVPGFNDPHTVNVGSMDRDKHMAYRYAFRPT